MALFYFASIEAKNTKRTYWFSAAIVVILAGFFTFGLSFNSPVKSRAKSSCRIKFAKNFNIFEVKKEGKIKVVKQLPKPKKSGTKKAPKKQAAEKRVARHHRVVPSSVLSRPSLYHLYQEAGNRFGIDWRILAAIHRVESGQAVNHFRISPAGARGPMQFLPSTFWRYAVDGDGDGRKNIYDVDDAVFTAARYLAANGGMTNIKYALYRYNHSWRYVNRVLSLASTF